VALDCRKYVKKKKKKTKKRADIMSALSALG